VSTAEPRPGLLPPLPGRIIRNTLFTTAGNWITLGINFLLVPYIVSHLGLEVYGGVWVVGMLCIAYAQLVDFGIGSSCVKFIAEHAARGEQERIRQVVSTGMAFYAVFACFLILGLVFWGKPLLGLIGVPEQLRGQALFVVSGALAIMTLMNTMAPLTSVLPALQRMDISNTILVVTNLLGIAQTLAILGLGGGARGLILGNLGVQVVSLTLSAYWAQRLLPGIRPRFAAVGWPTFRRLWSYGINLQISRISQIVVFQTDKLATLRFLGARPAAFYDVAVRAASLARSLPLVLTPALLPAASELQARSEEAKLAVLLERASRYLILAGTLLLGFVFLETNLIITTWMGQDLGAEGIAAARRITKILLTGYYLNMVTGVASTVAAGTGRTDLERKSGLLTLVLVPCLLIALFHLLGPVGIPLTTTLALSCGAGYYLFLCFRALGFGAGRFFRLFLKPLLALGAAMAVTAGVHARFLPAQGATRPEGVLLLAGTFLLFVLAYAGAFLALRGVDEGDRVILRALLAKLRGERGGGDGHRG